MTDKTSDYDREFWGDTPQDHSGEATDMVQPMNDVFQFLLGEGELQGCGFGEKPDTERGNFWWRKHLRAALAQPQGEPVGEVVIESMGVRGSDAMQVRMHFYKEIPPVGSKIYTTPPSVEAAIEATKEKLYQAIRDAETPATQLTIGQQEMIKGVLK